VAATAAPATSALDDLLGLSSALEVPAPAPAQPPGLLLEPRPALTPALFQGKWGSLQPAQKFTLPLPPSALAAIEANSHQVLSLACFSVLHASFVRPRRDFLAAMPVCMFCLILRAGKVMSSTACVLQS
jgi:hypothetical protein